MGDSQPTLQVIVLGSGGGPNESNTSAFLVRSVDQEWRKGSLVAVDAGVHLSAISRIIKEALPCPPPSLPHTLSTGPFAGLTLPHSNADANAQYIAGSLVDAYLITHPHLDHIAGFVINTAGPPGARPKKLAGLPGTIQAFKSHIFNNVIWPNLSDENNGAGLVTYLRLVEGGSPALGEGEGKGYSEICEGLLVKVWGVSHGHCIEKHSHRGSASSASGYHDAPPLPTPRRDISHNHVHASNSTPRRHSRLGQAMFGGSVGASATSPHAEQDRLCVYDSSAYFIQDHTQRREVLIFGDVEPDSISLSPRNELIWQEAAPKIAAGTLAAVFIECSFDDGQSNDRLFGHLKPFYVIEELQALAREVELARKTRSGGLDNKKRKRQSDAAAEHRRTAIKQLGGNGNGGGSEDHSISPMTFMAFDGGPDDHTAMGEDTPHLATPTSELCIPDDEQLGPSVLRPKRQLEGLKVVIIHIKDKLNDEPDVGETILRQLLAYEEEAQLGCDFVISKPGQSIYL